MNPGLEAAVSRFLRARARFGPLEIAFWIAAFATIWVMPGRHLILTETAIWGLFALSLDLILGYAGIISLGHAAFFGVGAYAAGLLAKHEIIVEPSLALLAAGLAAAALGFATSFLVLRGSDLTRLMVTLGVASVCYEVANKLSSVIGGADGLQGIAMAPIFGRFRFDLFGHTAYVYALAVLFMLTMLARRIVNSPFGLSLNAIKGNALRAAAIGIAVNWRLVAVYTLSAGYAGMAGGLLAQTQAFASLSMLAIERSADALLILIIGGTGYLYGGLLGALIYRFLQDYLSDLTARYWQFWIGLVLVMIVMYGRVWGGIIAALIIALTLWLDLSTMTSFIVTAGIVLALGLARDVLMARMSAAEQAAVAAFNRLWTARKLVPEGRTDHARGA
jgi:branched-chain amino acid transport system permease protein